MTKTTITVGILTYRRPARLAATLPLVLEQAASVAARAEVEVVVVDNDPACSARATVENLEHPLLRYVSEPKPGIAAARNRALDESVARDCLVFIDDDERPEPGWLEALLGTWLETGAAAVMGRVVSLFETPPSPFVAAGDFFWRPRMPSGTPIEVAAAGNLLLDMRQIVASGIRFDERLRLGGGEDTLFTRKLRHAGRMIVWCDESAAVDYVPDDRTTTGWVLTRAWSHGNTSARVEWMLAPTPTDRAKVRAKAAIGGVVRIGGGILRFGWGLASRSMRHRARGLRAVCRGAGMTAASVGHFYSEYARPAE